MDYRQVRSYLVGLMGQDEPSDGVRRGYGLIDFLLYCAKKDVPLLVSAPGIFMYSLLLPSGSFHGRGYSHLLAHWDDAHGNGASELGRSFRGWTGGALPAGNLLSGIASHGRCIVRASDPDNAGGADGLHVDLSRDFSGRHCLCKVSGRGVYCRLGRHGTVEDVVHLLSAGGMNLLTVARDLLLQHIDETGAELVRFMDLRVPPALVPQYSEGDLIIEPPASRLCLRVTPVDDGSLWCRGVHVMKGRSFLGTRVESRPLENEYIGEED